MKALDEIYWIIFNKVIRPDRIDSMQYILGQESILGIPKSIILKGTIITITFEDGKKHVIHYQQDCELFYREIKDGRDIPAKADKETIRRRSNTSKPRTT